MKAGFWSVRSLAAAVGFAGIVAATPGCAQFDLSKPIPWGAGDEGELARPMKVVGMWTDAIRNSAHQAPERGFGGRLMFYASEDGKPCKAKGSLVVYAFDETGRDPTNLAPDRKYVFTEEQFAKHYSKGPLGHSYSFWLPWDAVGGVQKEVSLIVRFSPAQGGVLLSEESKHLLPGSKPVDQAMDPPNKALASSNADGEVNAVGYVRESAGDAGRYGGAQEKEDAGQMEAITINMPMGMGRTPTALVRPSARLVPSAIDQAQGHMEAAGQAAPAEGEAEAANDAPKRGRFGPARYHAIGRPIGMIDRESGPWRPQYRPWRPGEKPTAATGAAAGP